jgi:hypothetical protein
MNANVLYFWTFPRAGRLIDADDGLARKARGGVFRAGYGWASNQ